MTTSAQTKANSDNSGKAEIVSIETLTTEIGQMYRRLSEFPKIGQAAQNVAKPAYQPLEQLLAFMAQGMANPTDKMNARIQDIHAGLGHLVQACQLLAAPVDTQNRGE